MYENYKLCDRLTPGELCFVVEQYAGGNMVQKFHEHVPWYRLGRERSFNLLRTFVFHFSGADPREMLTGSLNGRAKSPTATPPPWHTCYPEPGVLRNYCGANTKAWLDQVIAPDKFR